ncbi:hypothetical protein QBC37DRAFT_386702 [Rhypophila decipiens]|uniref:Uncharacterized protein n=1 Tax=Rhypophila decipiens TaxID=261697 RepID=A0AAN6Y9Y3_9PEZI|nr:hypothetical protein QBC37DRAFT_386702 [Rhypophila decipiens]
MRFTSSMSPAFITLVTLASLGSATWKVKFYKSGCPTKPDAPETGSISGEKGDELWCISAGWAHNIVLENIEADGMTVELFSGNDCSGSIKTISTDNFCHVIPSNSVLAAARIVPK